MCRTQCVLALLVLYVGLAHCFSWDVVVAGPTGLYFYKNGLLTHLEDMPSVRVACVIYDPVKNRLLYTAYFEQQLISSYDIATQKVNTLVTCTFMTFVFKTEIAYDPVTETLFRMGVKSLYSFSLKPGYNYGVENHVLTWNGYSSHIAVDSCGGYIYWSDESKIERARFDGSGREVVVNIEGSILRTNLLIDPQSQKMYWTDKLPVFDDYLLSIKSADLNGNYRNTLYSALSLHRYGGLTISKDSIYWKDATKLTFRQISKYTPYRDTEYSLRVEGVTVNSTTYQSMISDSLAANYKVEEQVQGSQSCPALTRLLPKTTSNLYPDVSLLCVHGTNVIGQSACKCTQGYTGARCDVSVCQNYCLHGDCSVSGDQPTCSCHAGYTGQRCEVNACLGYCSNNGICSVNQISRPVCQCTGPFKGDRCDVPVCQNYCIQGTCSVTAEGQPQCSCNAGYTGKRCGLSVCYKYCMNNGECSLNDRSEPVCECTPDYKGNKCEVSACQGYCIQGTCSISAEKEPICRCNPGYFGKWCGRSACTKYCLHNGVCSLTDKSEPVCQCTEDYQGQRCDVLTCQDYCFHGNCSIRADRQPECRCHTGYYGARCEVNACQGYCWNNGVCSLNKIGEPGCQCTEGYSGERCEVSVCQDYCFHGSCSVSTNGQPKCRCDAGYSGERCEVNACHEHCLNNGVCFLNNKSEPVCQCTGGFEGERCNISMCENYCVHGDCSVNANGTPNCRCYAGFYGERCEINGCHGYCLNNGVCSLNANSEPVCQCTGHYTGGRCDITDSQVNCANSAGGEPKCRCDSGKNDDFTGCKGYCFNNGVCSMNNQLEPVCQCTIGFEGKRCNVSSCQSYCFQGDCSVGADGKPICGCEDGYSGDRCEINACQGYCLNSSTCSMNDRGEPVCQCTDDYEGERCDASVSAFLMKCFRTVSTLSTKSIFKTNVP